MISVVIPTYNEFRLDFFPRVLSALKAENLPHEIIIVDGGSTDHTATFAANFGRVIAAANTNRAQRLNIGAAQAKYPAILFQHPRSILSKNSLTEVHQALQKDAALVGGGLTHSFDQESPLLKFTSWYSNKIRAPRGTIYLDHCIFIRRQSFEKLGGFPNIDIFEDTVFPQKMARLGKTKILKSKVVTSAHRFQRRGAWRHSLLNQLLKLGFNLGVSPQILNQIYEGKNPFNAESR